MSEKEFLMTKGDKEVSFECGADFVLPDYNGDVRKILYTEAIVRPDGKFMGEDGVEFVGQVVYKIIYSDSEGRLSSTEFTSDYEHKQKDIGEGVKWAGLDVRLANYSVRLVGPRRFSAKSSDLPQTSDSPLR